jgi:beta-lactam-binding protein with PASTA domain
MGKVHRWGMAVAFVVIIASAYFGIRTVFVEDKSATVPGMVGMQLVDAVEALQKEGLLAKVDQVDSPERADTVISQNLPAGEKVSKGKVVIIRVSRGG